jgi:hypothetical protein
VRSTPPGFPGAAGLYVLTAGHAAFHYSDGNIIGQAACDMRGSTSVGLFQHGGGSIGVSPVDAVSPFEQGPHDYGGDVGLGPTPRVTLTMENCAPGAESEEGKTYDIPIGLPPLDTGGGQNRSSDGIHYNGSHSQSASGIVTDWSWTLTGEK